MHVLSVTVKFTRCTDSEDSGVSAPLLAGGHHSGVELGNLTKLSGYC